jgi:hypothetical protein
VFNCFCDEDTSLECDETLFCERNQMLLFEAAILLLWYRFAILTSIAIMVYNTVMLFPFYEL